MKISTANPPKILKRKSVSAILPILNEEKTVAEVINRLITHPLIDEIICVNDGSTDNTKGILNSFKQQICVINLKENHGKGYALVKGIKQAKGDIVFFCDADLIGFSSEHIEQILNPLLQKKAKSVLGYPMGSSEKEIYLATLFKDVTGERAYYKKDLTAHLDGLAKTGYAEGIYLNKLFNKKNVKKIPLDGLSHLYKHQKYGIQKGLTETIKEVKQFVQEIGKSKRLLLTDSKIFNDLPTITNPEEIKKALNRLRSKKIKVMLKKYFPYLFYK